uniref:Transposase n=1 Tax=Chenopodium quinoa TaxID=63459 RepID=A0A803MRM9_CHEQI
MENKDNRNERCCGKTIELHPALFKDNSMSKGGVVKEKGQVLREHSRSICRLVDVAYGESHYKIARDFEAPVENVVLRDVSELMGSKTERQRRSGRQGRAKVEHANNVTKKHIGYRYA